MMKLRVENAWVYILEVHQIPHIVLNILSYQNLDVKTGVTINKSLVDKDNMRFPRGVLHIVKKCLKDSMIPYEEEDCIEYPTKNNTIPTHIHLRDYQEAAEASFLDAENGYKIKNAGIIQIATGGGKCQAHDSMCLTSNGMLEIGEFDKFKMDPGEYYPLDTEVGTPLSKTGLDKTSNLYYDGKSLAYNVKTKLGLFEVGTDKHQIKVLTENGHEWKRFDAIEKGDIAVIAKGQNLFGNNTAIKREDAYNYFNLCNIYVPAFNSSFPKELRTSPKKVVSEFIRALYDSGAWVEEKASICINVSKKMMNQLQVILLNFGIISHSKVTKVSGLCTLTIHKEYIYKFLTEIGLDGNSDKYKNICTYLEKVKENETNSNFDVIPNQGSVIKSIIEKIKILNQEPLYTDRNFIPNDWLDIMNPWIEGKINPNRSDLLKFTSRAKIEYGCTTKEIEYLEMLCSDEYYYSPVEEITREEADCYDFCIPETNSFISQGFINHNCVLKDTINLTTRGIEYMSDYDHGKHDVAEDCSIMLINRDGNFEKTKSFYNDGIHSVIKIKTEHGFELGGSETQKILEIKHNGKIDWIKLEDITLKTNVAIQHSQFAFGKDINLPLNIVKEFKDKYSVTIPNEINKAFALLIGYISSNKDYLDATKYSQAIKNAGIEGETFNVFTAIRELILTEAVPQCIRRAPRNIMAAFLSGIFDYDINKIETTYNLYSDKLARVIQIMLLNYGILCSRNKESIEIHIGSIARFEELITTYKATRESNGQNYWFDKIQSIEAGIEEIVDWEIPDTKSFFGNGFICHNTILAASCIAEINQPTIFFVHTRDLKVQTERVFSEIFGSAMVGSLGGGEESFQNPDGTFKFIVIAMIQSLAYHGKRKSFEVKPEYKKLLDTRMFAIFDESHHSSSDSWFWIAQQCKAPYRMGLSISGDSNLLIKMPDGSLKNYTISEFADLFNIENDHILEPGETFQIRSKNKDGTIGWKKINAIHKYTNNKENIHIKTQYNRSLKITTDHSIFKAVPNGNKTPWINNSCKKIVEMKAVCGNDLQEGDFVLFDNEIIESENIISEYNLVSKYEYTGQGHLIKILEIKKCEIDFVYDLSVQDNENFFANGILCHNSATPWRADGLGILLEAATGPVVYKISSKDLIERGWLSRPDIVMYPVDTQLDSRFYEKSVDEKNNYHRRSKVGIIFNEHRNAIIVAATKKAISMNETVLVIIKEKIHGFFLWTLLGGDKNPEEIVLVNGSFDSGTRRSIMNGFRSGKTKCIIATSTHYKEPIWVRNKHTGEIEIIQIGKLIESFKLNEIIDSSTGVINDVNSDEIRNYETLTELKDGTVVWRTIKAGIRHKNKGNVKELTYDNGMKSWITTDHSLVDVNYNQVIPEIGKDIKNLQTKIYDNQDELDLVKIILNSDIDEEELNTIEIELLGLDRDFVHRIQKLRTHKKLDACNDKYKTYNKLMPTGIEEPDNLIEFQKEYDKIVWWENWWEKGKFRCSLRNFQSSKYIKNLPHQLVVRRSKSEIKLPSKLPITIELAQCLGAFVAKGTLCKSYPSQYVVNWAYKDMERYDTRIGFAEKEQIRNYLNEDLYKVFGFKPENDELGIHYRSKLIYSIFSGLKISIKEDNNLRSRKQVPPFIWNCNTQIQNAFLFGYFLGDEHLVTSENSPNYTSVLFTSVSYELLCGIKQLLHNQGCKNITLHKKQKVENSHQQSYNMSISDDSFDYRKIKMKKFRDTNKITIKKMADYDIQPEYVYDISVEETETFYSGSGALLHNCVYDEGIDLPSVNVVIMGAGGKSDTKMIQRLGRALRLGNRCLFLDSIKNCQLLGTADNPYRCIKLNKDVSKYDSKTAAYYAKIEINEILGNIKHWSSTEYDVVGKRLIEDANAKEVQRMYNIAFTEKLISGKTGIEQIDKWAKVINQLFNDVHNALENDKIGKHAELGKKTLVLRNGEMHKKLIKPKDQELQYIKKMTKKATELLRICAWVIGVNKSVSVQCPHEKLKTTVKYIDFFDACDEVLLDHSTDRLKIYDSEEHEPREGNIDEDFSYYKFVKDSEGKILDYDEIMKNYGSFLIPEENNTDDEDDEDDEVKKTSIGYSL